MGKEGLNAADVKNAAEKEKNGEKEKKELDEKQKADLKFKSVLLMVCAFLSLLIIFIPGSSGWRGMHNILLGLFGVSVLTLPVVFFLTSHFMENKITGKKPKEHRPKTIGAYFLYGLGIATLVSGTVQIWFGGELRTKNFMEALRFFFQSGKENPIFHGGAISIVIAYPFSALLGNPGDKICVLILLFLVIMWLMGWDMHDLGQWFRKTGKALCNLLFPTSDQLPSEAEIPNLDEKKKKKPLFPLSRKKTKTKSKPKQTKKEAVASETENTQQLPPIPAEITETPTEVTEPLIEPFPFAIPTEAEFFAEEPIPADTAVPDAKSEPQPAEANTDQPNMDEVSPVSPQESDAVPTYHLPELSLLKKGHNSANSREIQKELKSNKEKLQKTLNDFHVGVDINEPQRGPTVTRYEVQPHAGVKVSKITGLADDIALSLAAQSVRIEAPIPGKSAIGIEVPNTAKDVVMLRDILESSAFQETQSRLAFAVGRNIAGEAIIGDIAKMPHVIIAGATGSGKSVCTNSIIMSILFHATPDEVRLILIDPKIVEFRVYENIPHLLIPVVTDPKKAAGALNWAVQEMERRYQTFADNGVRDLGDYNRKIQQQEDATPLPQIVIAIDELADLMMTASKEVEDAICRLAQKARAAGMHLIIATQRPTTDIITGLIKANIPSRIALSVMSQVDSRTILDTSGAEKLLGHGDMLYLPNGMPKPIRVQGCFVSTEEIEKTVAFIKQQAQTDYDAQVLEGIEQNIPVIKGERNNTDLSSKDPMLEDAIAVVVEAGQASTSSLQRFLNLGYARAARIMDELEKMGVIGPYNGAKPRKVLMTKQQWEERKMRNLP